MADSSLVADMGPLVRARGQRWRLERAEPGERCTACALVGQGPTNAARRLTLLAPFDRIEPWRRRARPRIATRPQAIRAAAATAAGERGAGILAAAAAARIALLPWQLVPALLLARGLSHRILLADAVGLGKTIQAGLAIAELRGRDPAARILVVVPAGLRHEWARELGDRFGLAPAMADLAWLHRRARALPADVNPWSLEPLVLTSMDFVKQPEVLAGLADLSWDLLVIDEAHAVGTDSERARAAATLAQRSRRVLLVTATPHDGTASRFDALASLGRLSRDEPPATLVHRGRAAIGLPADRRDRVLRVRPTPDEVRLRTLLARYAARVTAEAGGPHAPGARLGTSVLLKRALSSAAAFERTVRRRLALLSEPAAVAPHQPALPFEPDADSGMGPDDELPDQVLRYRGLANPAMEQAFLRLLGEAARVASRRESKVRALRRLLRRAGEPALVFTEYRDTLSLLARQLADLGPVALLHGALGPDDRQRALRAFARGPARLLLATDAASEGLNLHERCRLAITFELPWNPLRLEQRVGRVDRIGQTRRVHAVHLIARGTPEEDLLARLEARRARIAEALGAGSATGQGAAAPSDETGPARWSDWSGTSSPPAFRSAPAATSDDGTHARPGDQSGAGESRASGAGTPDQACSLDSTLAPETSVDPEAAAGAILTIRRARCLLLPASAQAPATPAAGDSGARGAPRTLWREPVPEPGVVGAAERSLVDAVMARIDARLACGHPWIACLRPCARRRWSGMLFVFVAARRNRAGHETSRTTIPIHVPIPVPVLRRRRDVRAWAVPRIGMLQAALEPGVARELDARWAFEGEADAIARHREDARGALVARAVAEARRRQAASPALFGRYVGPAATPPAPPGSGAASGHRVRSRRQAAALTLGDASDAALSGRPPADQTSDAGGPWLAVVLLAPGDGRWMPFPHPEPETGGWSGHVARDRPDARGRPASPDVREERPVPSELHPGGSPRRRVP
jgi:superfamily II DNA or RNA helicase